MDRKFPIYLLSSMLLLSVLFSCSDDNESGNTETISSATAITAFSLQADDDVLENLDSVFFTIDLDKAEIYNADSLPLGTDVSGLKVTMNYVTCSSASFHVTGGEKMVDTTFVYSEDDTIDFTGNVKFTIISQDLSAKQEYTIKVNVHKIEPDTLYWNELARRDLPAFSMNPVAQKTVQFKGDVYCMIKDAKAYVLSVNSDPSTDRWEKSQVELPFEPELSSFTAADNALYMLDVNNELYSSPDGLTWSDCGVKMYSISGSYADRLLGIIYEDGVYKHTEYPMSDGFAPYETDVDFPVSGVSPMITLSSKWAVDDQRIMVGGVTASGAYTGAVWGFDGAVWGKVSQNGVPAAKGMTLFAYYYTYFDVDAWKTYDEPVLLAVGGVQEDGRTMNRTMYISDDQGVTWAEASTSLQLPVYIPDFTDAQAFVYNKTLTDARSSDGWEAMPDGILPASLRVNSRAVTAITSWECPYVYLFGGTTANGTLYNNIWRGVINRLTFKPLY